MARGGNVKVRFGADTRDLERGAAKAGRAVDSFSRHANRSNGLLGAGTKRMLAYAGGITSVAAAAAAARDAVKFTEDLAKSSAALSRTTGLDIKTSSEWVETARLRGVEAQQLNRGFVTLAKNMRQVEQGGKSSAQAFKDLGVSGQAIASGDMGRVLMEAADAFKAMPDGARQAALAQQLFGRQSQTLIPLLNQGSAKLREQLGLVDQYGVALDKNGVQQALKAVEAQRRWQLAMDGLKVSLASGLIPVLSRGIGAAANFVREMRTGEGAGGRFAAKVREIWQNVKPTAEAIGRLAGAVGRFVGNHPEAQRMLAVLVPVGAALKVMGGASTVAGIAKLAGSLRSVGAGGAAAGAGAAALTNIQIAAWVAGAIVSLRNMKRAGIDPLRPSTITLAKAFDYARRNFNAIGPLFDRLIPGFRELRKGVNQVADAISDKLGTVRQYGRTWRDVANDIALVGQAITDLPSIPELSPNYPGTNVPQVPRGPGRRRGGVVYRAGGLVPSLLSPGEVVIPPGGGALRVPGAPVPADNVPMMLPSGSAVLTWDGQARMMAGQPLAGAVASQAPHFRTGGFASPTKVGASMFTASGEAGGYRGTLNRHPWAYAELSRKWHDWSALGGLPLGYKLAVSYGNRTVVAGKHDVGQGGGPVGGYHRSIDLLAPVARYLRLPGLGVVSIQSTDAPEGTKGPAALGSGREASRSTPRTVRWQTYQPPGRTTGRVSRSAWESGWQSGASDPFGLGRELERTDDYNQARARMFGVWASHSRTIPAARPHTAPNQGAAGQGRASRVVRWAKSQLGYHEGPGNRNKYGPSAPWCGYFVQAGLKNAGLSISQGMGYVPDIRNMISAGAAPFSGSVSAGAMQPGDVITWGGHTGFYIGGGKAISGNYGDAVREHGSTAPGSIVKAGRPRYRSGGIVGQTPGRFAPAARTMMLPSTRQQAYTSLWAMLNPGIAPGTEGAVKSAYARAQKVIDRLPYGDLRAFIADAQRIRRRTFGGPKVTQTMQSRVQQVIDYAGGALARVVSRPLGVSDSVQQSISDSASTLDDRLTLRGTDPASSEGIAAKTAFNNRSITRLWQRKSALQQSLARLKRIKPAGWRGQAKQITDEIGEIDRQVIGLAAENARTRASAPFENYGRAMSSIDLQERAGVLTAEQASALRKQVRTGALAGELGALSQDERWQVMADLKDAVVANTAQQEEQTKLLAEQVANQQKLVALVTAQGPALIAAVSAVVSGDIGGRVGLGFQSPSFAGGLARY